MKNSEPYLHSDINIISKLDKGSQARVFLVNQTMLTNSSEVTGNQTREAVLKKVCIINIKI